MYSLLRHEKDCNSLPGRKSMKIALNKASLVSVLLSLGILCMCVEAEECNYCCADDTGAYSKPYYGCCTGDQPSADEIDEYCYWCYPNSCSHSVYINRIGPLECCYAHECGYPGIWFPEEPPLFKPFMADPREICYSLGWRIHDPLFGENIVDVSYGDTLAIYEFCNVWPWNGQLRFELEGALWALFAPTQESSPLINADYYVGIPITYAIDRWAFRLRGYHISSHVGDEFLLLHPEMERFNPSAEYLDFFVSHDFTEDIRLYGGIGWVMAHDPGFCCGPFYAECGLELRLHQLQYVDFCNKLYGNPIFGMHFRFQRQFKNHIDSTYVLGYEWAKFCGLCRKVRVFLEYHDGYSLEGQFCVFPSNYLALRMTYGF